MKILCVLALIFFFFAVEIDIVFASSDFRPVSDVMSENSAMFPFSSLYLSSIVNT